MPDEPIEGCAHCGIGKRGHGQRHTIAAGWHGWTAPDSRLLHQRMWYRRLTRAWRSAISSSKEPTNP